MGLLLSVVVHPADVQDRDGAFQLLRRARLFPSIERIFADGGYAGKVEHRRLEIGVTWIGTAFQRTHINTEAKLLQLRYAFDVLVEVPAN
jgi:RimJ/RimL family protein N-acetyltransferase